MDKTVEIIGQNLSYVFNKLNISNFKCTYVCDRFCVYEIDDSGLEKLNNITDEYWEENFKCCWYRCAEGSNLGNVNFEFIINGSKIKAWRSESKNIEAIKEYNELDEDEKQEYKNLGEYIKEWFIFSYDNLLNYYCFELGVSTERNICAVSVDLAKQNNMKISELFKKYNG